jgi:3-hydroxyacyl-[acyl-carrier-protein] dehydratase
MIPAVTELIPHRPPFLFVDEIVSEEPAGLVARKTWRADEDFYRGHYPGAPITPGVLLCEAVFQAGALHLSRQSGAAAPAGSMPVLVKISDVRFRQPVYPGDTVLVEVRRGETMGGFTRMSGGVTCGGKRVLTVEFTVAWKTLEPHG